MLVGCQVNCLLIKSEQQGGHLQDDVESVDVLDAVGELDVAPVEDERFRHGRLVVPGARGDCSVRCGGWRILKIALAMPRIRLNAKWPPFIYRLLKQEQHQDVSLAARQPAVVSS